MNSLRLRLTANPRQIVNQVQHFLLKFLLEFSNQDTSWDGY